MLDRNEVVKVLAEHWVEKWDDPRFPTSVRCMKQGCDWQGRFPGDIAEHNADLIMEAEREDREKRSRLTFDDVRAKFIAGGGSEV